MERKVIPQVAIDLTSDGESDEGPLVQFSSETDELVKLDHFSVHTARQQQRNLAVIAPNTFYQQRLSVPTDTASSRSLNNKSDNGSLDPVRSNETTISSFSSLRGKTVITSAQTESIKRVVENKLKQIDQSVKNDQAAKFLAIFEENRKQEYPRRQHVIADFDFDGAANTTQALARTGAYKIVEYATINECGSAITSIAVRNIEPSKKKTPPEYTHFTQIDRSVLVEHSELQPNPRPIDHDYIKEGAEEAFNAAPDVNLRHEEDFDNSFKIQRLVPYHKRIAKAAKYAQDNSGHGDEAIDRIVETAFELRKGSNQKLQKRAKKERRAASNSMIAKSEPMGTFSTRDMCDVCGRIECDWHRSKRSVGARTMECMSPPGPATIERRRLTEKSLSLIGKIDWESDFGRRLDALYKEEPNPKARQLKKPPRGCDWFDREHELTKRSAPHPCYHPGLTCTKAGNRCSCAVEQIYCSKNCACEKVCERRYPGCKCKNGCPNQIPNKYAPCDCIALNRECDPDYCHEPEVTETSFLEGDPSDSCCQNCEMQRGIKKKTFAGRSEVKGYGLFIGEAIKKFEFIDEYVGEIITQSEADRRMTRHRKGDCNYQFEVNTEQTIDSAHFGNLTRFINHSSDAPNCKSTVKLVNAEHRIGFYALRDIKRHEELLFDYGVTFANELKEQYADNGDVDEEMADAPADDEDDIEDEDDDVIADEDEDQDVSPSESETAVEDTIDQALVKPRRVDGMIFDDTDEEM